MKFVIKSLLFVSLLLQLTSSLRKCFDQEQNLMLTIILLAFSLIGLIGLTIGNRFILITFAACTTLILIASITIYAINRSEKDALKPKIPYYISSQEADERRNAANADQSKLKSLVNKFLNRNQRPSDQASTGPRLPGAKGRARGQGAAANRSRYGSQQQIADAPKTRSVSGVANNYHNKLLTSNNSSSIVMLVAPLDDYTDEPASIALGSLNDLQTGSRSTVAAASKSGAIPPIEMLRGKQASVGAEQQQDSSQDDGDLVPSEQWIAYERHLYEKYLNIVSQSIDLIMQTILASWMALLLDEDSDQCFGGSSSTRSAYGANTSAGRRHSSGAHDRGSTSSKAPVYNYNGVRYSIRPDTGSESPTGVAVH